jgi:DNA-directed RNA polymerase I subunit RPA49
MELSEMFGSKRSKAALQAQLNGQVDTKTLENVASQIYDSVKTATENIPSLGTNHILRALTTDEMMDAVNADRPIPTIDLTAQTPAELYSLDSIVSESELALIDAEAIWSLPDESARLAAIPFKYDLPLLP